MIIRFPNWIGDIFMALPVLDIASELWPRAEIGVQVHDRGRVLLEGHPLVARLHRVPARGGVRFGDAVGSIREGRYDLGVLLAPSFSSAWILYLAGIPRRVGWTGDGRRFILSDSIRKPGLGTRLVGQYQDVFRPLGYRGKERPLGYRPPEEAVRAADAWLSERRLVDSDLVALAPAAMHGPAKRWPEGSWRELARRFAGSGRPVVAIGAQAERDLLDTVTRDIPGAHVLAGELDLRGAAALVARCRLLVGNDTGILHMARAMKTPVVGLYGSTTPSWSGPEPFEGEFLYRGLPCSPCFKRECPLRENRMACLEEISVTDVLAAAERALLPGRTRA